MRQFQAHIYIQPKDGILDPQGKAVHHALSTLGLDDVDDVRVGKFIIMMVSATDEVAARETVTKAGAKLLANPVIEDFRFDLFASEGGEK